MNLAFNSIVLFVWFILPSLIYRKFYYASQFAEQYYRSSVPHIIIGSIVPSIIIQIVYYKIIVHFTQYDIDFNTIVELFYSSSFDILKKDIADIQKQLELIVCYHLGLWSFSLILGFLSFKMVRLLKLDRKYKIFRYQDGWYYLITGEIPIKRFWHRKGNDVLLPIAHVLVNNNGQQVLYSGFIADYRVNIEKLELQYFYLSKPTKKILKANPTEKNENTPMPLNSDLLVIPNSEVLNVSFDYRVLSLLENDTLSL